MNKLSKLVCFILIGSAVLLAGCPKKPKRPDPSATQAGMGPGGLNATRVGLGAAGRGGTGAGLACAGCSRCASCCCRTTGSRGW